MERDMDLVRSILMEIEEAEDSVWANQLSDSLDADQESIAYHFEIMIEGGLLQGDVSKNESGSRLGAFVQRMTWEGHEFLDATRTPEIWEEAKQAFAEKSASMTFDVARKLAQKYTEQKLGLDE